MGALWVEVEQSVVKDAEFVISREWENEKNLSPRQDSNPDLPDTGRALLIRVLHAAGISNVKSVPYRDKY